LAERAWLAGWLTSGCGSFLAAARYLLSLSPSSLPLANGGDVHHQMQPFPPSSSSSIDRRTPDQLNGDAS
jgi:hypothetical protein